MYLTEFLRPQVLAFAIPLAWPVWFIVSTIARHRERMAMIERGMDPDAAKRRDRERREMIKHGMNPDALTPPERQVEPASQYSQPRR